MRESEDMSDVAMPPSSPRSQATFGRNTCVLLLLASISGCYADRLPEEVQHLGVARVSGIEIDPIAVVKLEPTQTIKLPLRLKRNGNEGPIDISLSPLPTGVEATFQEQMAKDASEVEIELAGDSSLGDSQQTETITIFLTMEGETREQTFELELPKVSRPIFVTPPPVFLQPGDSLTFQVPIERNGYGPPITVEPVELAEGVTCTVPEEPIEETTVTVSVSVAETAADGRLSTPLRTTIYGRELVTPLTIIISKQPFALKQAPLARLLPGETQEVELPVERDSLESLSRLVTGGISALTGVHLVPERFNGAIDVSAGSTPAEVTVAGAQVQAATQSCRLQVTATDEAKPGLYPVSLRATAGHLESTGLLVVRVVDQTLEPGKLPAVVVEAMASLPRRRRGGVAGRSTAESRRLLGEQYGVSQDAEKSIKAAISWLAESQADDGSWRPQTIAGEGEATVSSSTGGQPASTALALLPFLAEGVTYDRESANTAVWLEDYPKTVELALLWLGKAGGQVTPQVSDQTGEGTITEANDDQQDLQGVELGLIVASEVSDLAGNRNLKQQAILVAKELVKRQLPEGDWREDGHATSLTAAHGLLALHVAKSCGVNASAAAFRRAEKYFTQMGIGPETAPHSQYPLAADGTVDPTATAAALLVWQYSGQAADSANQVAGASYLSAICPEVNAISFDQPVDYLLHAGSVLRNLEGDRFDLWQAKVVSFLTRTQEREGENVGSWDPTLFSGGKDRLRTTVIATLCLQNAYRYLPLYRE